MKSVSLDVAAFSPAGDDGDFAGPRNASAQWPNLALAAMVAGCGLLVARPPLLRAAGDPVAVLVLIFTALLAVGALWPIRGLPGDAGARRTRTTTAAGRTAVLALGLAAFAAGRVLGGGEDIAAPVGRLLLLNTLAAVAEEAFFRRLAYRVLASSSGEFVAVFGSAALFALVHVTVYGLWVLPLDLAAGLILSWQRWSTGTWTVPAVTHVAANVMVVL